MEAVSENLCPNQTQVFQALQSALSAPMQSVRSVGALVHSPLRGMHSAQSARQCTRKGRKNGMQSEHP
jgi:hypothetical protein